jgi:hypothetical protein
MTDDMDAWGLGETDIVESRAALPTYATIADVLEKKNGSGVRLVGWTLARTLLIMPGMLAVGVQPKKAFLGSLISSSIISVLTLVRIYNAGFEQDAERWAQMKRDRKLADWDDTWSRRRERVLRTAKRRRDRMQRRYQR